MSGTQFQMKSDIVTAEDGTHHVRFVVQYGPLANILILPPDAMERVCAQYAEIAAVVIPEARRMDAMGDFAIVTDMPKLPPMNGKGGM